MLRLIFLTMLVATPIWACDDEAPSLAVRDAIYANDIDQVEALLVENQELFEAGARTAEDTRCMFRHFTKFRPATFELIDDWLVAYPESPFAHSAQSWANYVVSWQVRGSGPAREVYTGALTHFNTLQRKAWQHAEIAYRLEPRLISASDAVIKLANANHQRHRGAIVLDEVMTTDPNVGTLDRAVYQIIPGWGRTWKEGLNICETYAEHVRDAGPDVFTQCKLKLSQTFDDQREWMIETLETGLYPDLDYLRLSKIIYMEPSRETLEVAYRVMSQVGYRNDRFASAYDFVAMNFKLPLLTEVISQRRRDYAQSEIEHSPLSLQLLDMLEEPLLTSTQDRNGTQSVTVVSHIEPDLALEYARRRVEASPYDPKAWDGLLTRMFQNGLIGNVMEVEPYRINKIVYSNHSEAELGGYIFEKVMEYDAYQQATSGELPAEMLAMFDGLEEERDVLCPILRAVKLQDAVCEARGQTCKRDPNTESAIAVLEDDAKQRGICVKERSLPASALAFSPMPVAQVTQ